MRFKTLLKVTAVDLLHAPEVMSKGLPTDARVLDRRRAGTGVAH